MQLLISVAGPADARAALLGGADVIDAKDPRHGALGPVTLHRLAAIRAAVGGARPLSARRRMWEGGWCWSPMRTGGARRASRRHESSRAPAATVRIRAGARLCA